MICAYDVQYPVYIRDLGGAAKAEEHRIWHAISLSVEKVVSHTIAVATYVRLAFYVVVNELRKVDRTTISNGAECPRLLAFNVAPRMIHAVAPLFRKDVTAVAYMQDGRRRQRVFGSDDCSKAAQMPKRILGAAK